MIEGDEELMAIETRFRALVAEWDLGPSDTAAMLGVDREELGLDLMPRRQTGGSERRMRMLVEIRSLLPRVVVADCRAVPTWLRSVSLEQDPEGKPGLTPLAFLRGPVEHVAAMRDALRREAGR